MNPRYPSLRASILARDSEDHGTVDAQAGVFGEGQSDQWICPIPFSWCGLPMGCHISLMLKGELIICSPTPQIFRKRARKHQVTEHQQCLPSIPVGTQNICHSRWNFRDAMIQEHHNQQIAALQPWISLT